MLPAGGKFHCHSEALHSHLMCQPEELLFDTACHTHGVPAHQRCVSLCACEKAQQLF